MQVIFENFVMHYPFLFKVPHQYPLRAPTKSKLHINSIQSTPTEFSLLHKCTIMH